MSITITLAPLVIAFVATGGLAAIEKLKENNNVEDVSLETIFNDSELLAKTLKEHGLDVSVENDNHVICLSGEVQLNYTRESEDTPFVVTISGLEDPNSFVDELECFEKEYQQNVQSFTYEKLMSGIEDRNMTLSDEQILEDNSILLTIEVDD